MQIYLTTIAKHLILDIWQGSEYATVVFAETSSKNNNNNNNNNNNSNNNNDKLKTSPCHPKCYIFEIKRNWHMKLLLWMY